MFRTKLPTAILIAGIVIFCIGIISCEKDDICIDGNTPLLVVRFYDADNRTELKKVPKFRIVGIGQKSTVSGVSDRTDLDSIAIPLKVTNSSTGFYFISNSVDVEAQDQAGQPILLEGGDLDSLYFNYNRKDKFVSRACGHIANFDNLSGDLRSESQNWIKDIEITTPLVENSTEAHVKIYH
ncbi:DUF6452 family protein [Arenibacter certesii]|uniref:Uncharacterized protein n=1 Tax=Arenibacter certesii TaxID=228955 RepID=A0A918IUW8_9FLAO|nr:DUF6452 family protein [Arenibacter certesii]GGW31349.1 hypothetical protein GCM10007383_15830 [Arenibacter certesii]